MVVTSSMDGPKKTEHCANGGNWDRFGCVTGNINQSGSSVGLFRSMSRRKEASLHL